MATTSVRQFLETYDLYRLFRPGNAVGWRASWPQVVNAPCYICGEDRPHTVWSTKVAGFTFERGVYMIQGICERCGNDGVMFWVEVNQREGWMRKAGQLPALALGKAVPQPS